jgi:hypothetical protein
MEYVFGIAGIQPLVLGLLRKGKRSISEMNQLLQDESYMEKLVSGLKKLLDGFKGASFHEDIPELNKELYVLLEEKCTNLYDEMRRIKETFQRQNNRRGNSFRVLSTTCKKTWKLHRLQSEFDSLIKIIVRLENTLQFTWVLYFYSSSPSFLLVLFPLVTLRRIG